MLLISILRHQLRLIPGQKKTRKRVSSNYSGYIRKNVQLMSLKGFFSVLFLLFSMMCIFVTGILLSSVILICLMYFKFAKTTNMFR